MHFTIDRLLVLFAVLLCLGAMLWMSLAMLLAWGMLRPPRMSAGKAIYHLRRLSPGDLGLMFEEQPFTVRDSRGGEKINIAGWWIPAATMSEKCVVLLHGYADAKVGSIAWAPMFHEFNFNILAIDLRAHGESGGRFCTGGYFEREDVDQVIDSLLNIYPDQTRQLILFGASLGATIACAVAKDREDISVVILESPYADYERAIAAQVRMLGLPGGLFLKFAISVAQWVSGAKFDQVRPVELMKKLKCPAMTIIAADDELLDAGDLQLIEAATMVHPASVFWKVEDTQHLQAMTKDPVEYLQRVGDFLSKPSRF